MVRGLPFHAVCRRIHRLELLDALRPICLNVLVGIHPARKIQYPRRDAFFFEDIQRAQNRVLSCRIAVIGNPDFGRIPLEQPRLFQRQRRAQRCADARHTRLNQRNNVHISFG